MTDARRLVVDVRMVDERCNACGRWYSYEVSGRGACPRCMRELVDLREGRIRELERSLSALRGALTKRKKEGA